jgi:hypothetical protein
MIPATVASEHSRTTPHEAQDRPVAIRFWLPVILLWIILAPFLILLSPLLILGLAMVGLNPFRALAGLLGLMAALGGTHIEVETPDAHINIHLI